MLVMNSSGRCNDRMLDGKSNHQRIKQLAHLVTGKDKHRALQPTTIWATYDRLEGVTYNPSVAPRATMKQKATNHNSSSGINNHHYSSSIDNGISPPRVS